MNEITHGKIIPIDLSQEMKQSYLDYAMSVIVGRALPDVRDGLKPVHRRILYAMSEMGFTNDKPYKKCARVVGEVLGKYHPHGDMAVYDALVRMAQDFSIRYPLLDGHGNFGSIDGDSAAAMRYTEVRLAKITDILLQDIDKDTVDFKPNFDETLQEPWVLPSKFPNILVNGSSGIAVGMATNIPPHNLGEVIDGTIKLIDNPDISINQLIETIKGPDFPTGGIIKGKDGIKNAYKTGRGVIKIQGEISQEQINNGKTRLVITELPYQVNKAKLIEKIAELVRDKKIDGITDLRDESDRKGMRVVIELRKDAKPEYITNLLLKHTQLQQTYGIIMLALVDNQPKVLNLKDILIHYLNHQRDVITRRTKYDLNKAEARAHILEGLRIALDNIDEVIKTIRGSKTTNEAKEGLINKFGLSDKQAQAILDMRLQRLTGLEREKIETEYNEVLSKIKYYKELLEDPKKIDGVIKEELLEVKEKYNDQRRTRITADDDEIDYEDLIAEEDVVVTITHQGYIKRLPSSTYKSQKRGGRGVTGIANKNDDFIEHLFITSSHNYILFFTNKGKVYRKKVYEITESGRQSRGTSIVNILPIEKDEKITSVMPIKEFTDGYYLFFATKKGYVKKTKLEEFENIRKNGLIAISLAPDDELVGVKLTDGNQKILLGSENGLGVKFDESDVREMGRSARGVKGINLNKGDKVIDIVTVNQNEYLLTVTNKGFGKRTKIEEYREQSRGGKGIKLMNLTDKNGKLVALKSVSNEEDIMVVTNKGFIIRQNIEEIGIFGRTTQGVRLVKLTDDDYVVAVAKVVSENEQEE
ncbi:DNA gyrase subunit A [Anaerobranca californiensis DSM 14826]|jgi:DNA gyrase subunit A|uniref:DNA gyrase subunit A n=1 Tax=Anaerobranca californiensis DSM 14826 TaxID=1120989 RepID=A0A1M6M1M3_9FIRM|nr:DNA gyrase subunit A [Anaerobranca californiensis]SHJ77200.1 DNA gyrase subunit A [Anaerobranca californiensis DSM 14826]